MSDVETGQDVPEKKKSKLPLLIGLVLMLALGGGGFFVMYSGMLGGDHKAAEAPGAGHDTHARPAQDMTFLPLDPLIVSLGSAASNRHLKFTAQLEVNPAYAEDVALMMPRVLDVLNGYLRAVDMADLEDPSALIRLRAQMLRRVQIVTGDGHVRDLLITEFVLN